MRRPCRRVELHHLPTGRVLAWEHTPQSLARQLRPGGGHRRRSAPRADDRYRGPAGDRADATFPPQPGPPLRLVRLPRALPRGQRGAAGRRPWDGLDLEVAPILDPTAASGAGRRCVT